MRADPLLLTAGEWLGIAAAGLLLITVVAFVARWGFRFRLVGVTSFTVLLSLSCLAFAVSYALLVDGAVSVPVVFDNGSDQSSPPPQLIWPLRPLAQALSRSPATCGAAAERTPWRYACAASNPKAMGAIVPSSWPFVDWASGEVSIGVNVNCEQRSGPLALSFLPFRQGAGGADRRRHQQLGRLPA